MARVVPKTRSSHDAGSGFTWFRGHAEIQGDSIVLRRKRAIEYEPEPSSAIVFALAGIRDRKDVCRFVSEYGILECAPVEGDARESFAQWTATAAKFDHLLRTYQLVRAASDGSKSAIRDLNDRLI